MDAYDKISVWNRLFTMAGGLLSLVFAYGCLEIAQTLWQVGAHNGIALLYALATGIFLASMPLMIVGVLAVSGAFAWRGAFTGRSAAI